MKVGVAVRRWSERGGLERNVLGLVRHLVARGHQVEVVAQRREVEVPGVLVRPVGMSGLWPEALKVGRFSALAARALAEGGYDVTFTSGHVAGPDVVRLEMGLCHEHFSARPEVLDNRVERAVAKNEAEKLAQARRILALSNQTAATLREHHHLPSEKIAVVRNGVDLDHFQPTPLPRGEPPTLAFIGSGFARKGLGPLLEALALGPKARLVVAGEDRDAARYAAQARRLGVELQLIGYQPDIRPVLAAADLVVVPSLYDPYGLTVLEALASGRAVVTTKTTGAHEISPFPELVVDAPTPTLLAQAINRGLSLVRDPPTAARARAAAEAWPLTASYLAIEELLQAVASER
ncbi:MAG: glycosyltransferase family 4 protein [Deltaproteobacteria bacterium]|nr:glycosyltransferase family 4 protein [Deltaproteobacteria bacterium]